MAHREPLSEDSNHQSSGQLNMAAPQQRIRGMHGHSKVGMTRSRSSHESLRPSTGRTVRSAVCAAKGRPAWVDFVMETSFLMWIMFTLSLWAVQFQCIHQRTSRFGTYFCTDMRSMGDALLAKKSFISYHLRHPNSPKPLDLRSPERSWAQGLSEVEDGPQQHGRHADRTEFGVAVTDGPMFIVRLSDCALRCPGVWQVPGWMSASAQIA